MEVWDRWADSFAAFLAMFAGLFGRSEPREQLAKYLRALLATVTRKNGWHLAEAAGDACPDRMQRLLYRAHWDAEAARDVVRRYIVAHLGAADGIGIVDETGFLKKGTYSVGVKRQYSGTAGRTENCQIGTFLAYATARGQTLLDRRLYLPEEWCADAARRRTAQVPETVAFQTKPQQAVAMLQAAWEGGVPMRWVTGDAIYGDARHLREAVHASGRWYVLGISASTTVWTARPMVVTPHRGTGGRPRTRARVAGDAPAWQTVAAVAAALPAAHWHRLTVREGTKGPIPYQWARVRMVERVAGLPGRTLWLLLRRSLAAGGELKYFFSNAPTTGTLSALARVASTRFAVEQCFEEAKGEAGLDEYEVRRWQSWHRHITLTMMAHAWLAVTRAEEAAVVPMSEPQKGGRGSVSRADGARSAAFDRDGRAVA